MAKDYKDYGNYQGENEFAAGWFLPSEGETYKRLVSQIKNGTMIEVGSFEGLSLFYIKDVIKDNNIECHSVDIDDRPNLIENTKNWGIKFIHLPSLDAAKLFEDNSIDLIFIDADHGYESVCQDIKVWLPKVKSNGILMGHDYDNYWPGVMRAVDEMLHPVKMEGRIWIYQRIKL